VLEHHGAALPAWLAPDQVSVVPVGAAHREAAAAIARELQAAGVRARVDASEATLARRIALAHHDGVPFQIVLGDKELAGGTLAIRARDAQWWAPRELAIADLAKRCRSPDQSSPVLPSAQ
ncbi:MAG TPA: His/Gly/Thr/Pro-type tRNA ligase C-terminal domain-containing protein, partial [Kofleriaceae bacterium]